MNSFSVGTAVSHHEKPPFFFLSFFCAIHPTHVAVYGSRAIPYDKILTTAVYCDSLFIARVRHASSFVRPRSLNLSSPFFYLTYTGIMI